MPAGADKPGCGDGVAPGGAGRLQVRFSIRWSNAMAEEIPGLTRPAAAERRVHRRFGVNSPVAVILVRSGSSLEGTILDLSMGGCRIRTDKKFPLGIYTRVETEFRVDGIPLRLGGVVQVIHQQCQLGIRFLEMTERKRLQLSELLEEMRESQTACPPRSAANETELPLPERA
jgi:hypothetical protein